MSHDRQLTQQIYDQWRAHAARGASWSRRMPVVLDQYPSAPHTLLVAAGNPDDPHTWPIRSTDADLYPHAGFTRRAWSALTTLTRRALQSTQDRQDANPVDPADHGNAMNVA